MSLIGNGVGPAVLAAVAVLALVHRTGVSAHYWADRPAAASSSFCRVS